MTFMGSIGQSMSGAMNKVTSLFVGKKKPLPRHEPDHTASHRFDLLSGAQKGRGLLGASVDIPPALDVGEQEAAGEIEYTPSGVMVLNIQKDKDLAKQVEWIKANKINPIKLRIGAKIEDLALLNTLEPGLHVDIVFDGDISAESFNQKIEQIGELAQKCEAIDVEACVSDNKSVSIPEAWGNVFSGSAQVDLTGNIDLSTVSKCDLAKCESLRLMNMNLRTAEDLENLQKLLHSAPMLKHIDFSHLDVDEELVKSEKFKLPAGIQRLDSHYLKWMKQLCVGQRPENFALKQLNLTGLAGKNQPEDSEKILDEILTANPSLESLKLSSGNFFHPNYKTDIGQYMPAASRVKNLALEGMTFSEEDVGRLLWKERGGEKSAVESLHFKDTQGCLDFSGAAPVDLKKLSFSLSQYGHHHPLVIQGAENVTAEELVLHAELPNKAPSEHTMQGICDSVSQIKSNRLELWGTAITDRELESLSAGRTLHKLDLNYTQIQSLKGLSFLDGLEHLTVRSTKECPFFQDGFQGVPSAGLQSLTVEGTAVGMPEHLIDLTLMRRDFFNGDAAKTVNLSYAVIDDEQKKCIERWLDNPECKVELGRIYIKNDDGYIAEWKHPLLSRAKEDIPPGGDLAGVSDLGVEVDRV